MVLYCFLYLSLNSFLNVWLFCSCPDERVSCYIPWDRLQTVQTGRHWAGCEPSWWCLCTSLEFPPLCQRGKGSILLSPAHRKQHAFLQILQFCFQGHTVCNGVFLKDESLLICKISCHSYNCLSQVPDGVRCQSVPWLHLHILETAWRSGTCRSGGSIRCQ